MSDFFSHSSDNGAVAVAKLGRIHIPGSVAVEASLSPNPVKALARGILECAFDGAEGMGHATNVFIAAGHTAEQARLEVQALMKASWTLDD